MGSEVITLVDDFLIRATADPLLANGPAHHNRRSNSALRMLQRYPEIARHDIHTAIVCGDVAEVRRLLAERPELATEPGGPLRQRKNASLNKLWTPLLTLCYGRLPLGDVRENSVAIAELLLDHGADPNDYFEVGSFPSRYTALCGVVGEGEDDAPPHVQRNALAKLLLDRGAEPYDVQVLYNVHFHGKILWLMELIYETSVTRGRDADWLDPRWSMLDMFRYGSGARYLLNIAVKKTDLELAEWLLAHGATPNPPPPEAPQLSKLSLYQEALNRGYVEMSELLARYGAPVEGPPLNYLQEFSRACLALDRKKIDLLIEEYPDVLQSHVPIFAAAERDRADVVALLLDLGTPIEVEDETKQRPLHVASWSNSLNVARLLVQRGANLEATETSWTNVPIDFAFYGDIKPMIEYLSSVSNDIYRVMWAGNLERLEELLKANPELAKSSDENNSPLMWLPDDATLSFEMAQLLLDHGADASITTAEGLTAADLAERRALYDTANLVRTATR